MAVIQVINQTDQINNAFIKVNDNFLAVNQGLINVSTGHDHDGVNSKTVDHTKLINIGVNSHSVIDTAINNLTSHLSNTNLHVSTEEQTAWDGVVSEVVAARSSAAKSTVYDNLDDRLEAIESESSPAAHDGLSGRHTAATGNGDNDSRHKATAIYDTTGERTVQEALDDLEGNISTLTSNKANKATIIAEINASTEATLIEKEHVEQPDLTDNDISAGNYAIMGFPVAPTDVRLRLSALTVAAQLRNLLWNGTLNYLGGDSGRSLTRYPIANKTNPYTIPGWKIITTSETTTMEIEEITGTPPWHDYSANDVFRNTFGYRQLTYKPAVGDTSTYLESAPIPIGDTDSEPRFITISLWYKTSTAYADSPFRVTMDNVAHYDVPVFNDTDWHKITLCALVSTPQLRSLRIDFNTDATNISIARIGVWDAILSSTVHLEPYAWYNPMFTPYKEGATSATLDTPPAAGEIFKNAPEFKKTWRAEIPVDTSLTSPLTIPIPPSHYVYNVRVVSDYKVTVPIPTTPPTSVDTWYSYFDITSATNWTTSFNSISLSVPTPPTDTNHLIVEVDYWPAENS